MRLALFFTRNISLAQWVEQGLFDREKLLYEAYLEQGRIERVFWITYGAKDGELAISLARQGRLHTGITVLPRPSVLAGRFGRLLYSLLIPFIHFRHIRTANVLKTNQMDGSWSALLAKAVFGKPLLLRTGYTASLFMDGAGPIRRRGMMLLERLSYAFADLGEVASDGDRDYLVRTLGADSGKISVLRNFVDTERFTPAGQGTGAQAAVFVGRLTRQKNLFNMISAVREAGLELHIYGKGELEKELRKHATGIGAKVEFRGVVENRDLPGILAHYRYFLLCSLYEGMPKSLIEAMACGLICVGTPVPGIRELIEDGETGVLARGTGAASLAEALSRAEKVGVAAMGVRAREKIQECYSLESVVDVESRNIQTLLLSREMEPVAA